jgi:hypothetical protein
MHGSLHLVLAHESVRVRQAEAHGARRARWARRPLGTIASKLAAAHGVPPRAAPGTDSPALRRRAASLRGR